MAEKLALVTEFGSLKAGDLVVVKPCPGCGHSHREILLLPGTWGEHPCWTVEPLPNCAPPEKGPGLIVPWLVTKRVVYLVDTGLEQSETTAKAESRPLELIRG